MASKSLRPLVAANKLLSNPTLLRERAAADGYLYFRRLIPRADVLKVRRDILEILRGHGWLGSSNVERDSRSMQSFLDGIQDHRIPSLSSFDRSSTVVHACSTDLSGLSSHCGDEPPAEAQASSNSHDWPFWLDVQRLISFHAIPHHPTFSSVLHALFGETPLLHPRHIARTSFPNCDHRTTPAHQDFPYVQGTQKAWTCWVPLGDIERVDAGPLLVLPRSHTQFGLRSLVNCPDVGPFVPVSYSESESCGGWATATSGIKFLSEENVVEEGDQEEYGYQAGDVLMFNCLTVHQAAPNSSQAVRLSADYRCQPRSEPCSRRALTPNWDEQSWEQVYSDWPIDSVAGDLRYYWTRGAPPLDVVSDERGEDLTWMHASGSMDNYYD
ncbi:hypothetical protein CYMTET_30676 [Cymbomonas tetramitiformis]|uniref:Phytanoyl-CoA dioxygenase n=1 Tax=Cymbomonas tetramitiformis TaxID=36881 RepID=A0AAE0FJV8_9CHLO|nr:hypothetical protein CYMTET_30676 [Cymbomonas tetramitiformis]